MASQLTPARLRRLYRNVLRFTGNPKWQAALAAAHTAVRSQDRLCSTFEVEESASLVRVPDVSFAAGQASEWRMGRVAILLSPKLDCPAQVLKHTAEAKIPLVTVTLGSEPQASLDRLGIPTIVVEAVDAVALYRVLQESLLHARLGAGPTVIVCQKTIRQTATGHIEEYLRQKQLRRRISSKA